MKRSTSLICWIVVAITVMAGFVYWQNSKLGRAIRTMPAEPASEVLVGALSGQVLSPSLSGNAPNDQGTVLDEYRKNPALTHQRYLLVLTWTHAGQMFEAIKDNPTEGVMVTSASLTNVPAKDRVDGWGNPYCFLTESKRITFMSSGGNGVLNCEDLRQTAQQAASKATDSRLFKEGNLLVAVYGRVREDSSIRPR